MAKKSSFALKQLVPEENPKTGTKYIVRKPSKGLKVSKKMAEKFILSSGIDIKFFKKYIRLVEGDVKYTTKSLTRHSKDRNLENY